VTTPSREQPRFTGALANQNRLKLGTFSTNLESAVLGKDWERARDRFISGWGGVELVGTPEQIVERLSLIAETGCDGTLLMFPIWEEGLVQFRDKVMPLLEQAGLRKPYVSPSRSAAARS
jgi:alkanesulfonate monooxygenase SsuD/methylene tetrahydromethanopterin reductase-like flavin-dependent oxidoreductase (luciferase family)